MIHIQCTFHLLFVPIHTQSRTYICTHINIHLQIHAAAGIQGGDSSTGAGPEALHYRHRPQVPECEYFVCYIIKKACVYVNCLFCSLYIDNCGVSLAWPPLLKECWFCYLEVIVHSLSEEHICKVWYENLIFLAQDFSVFFILSS